MTPAATAASISALVASVCPAATTTPRSTSAAITSAAPGSSGASVTRATPAAADQPSITCGDGGRRSRSAWAPRRAGFSIGPSRWSPSTAAWPG